jgi:cytoplasmic iron level regulating protein YaaA (DUF328/UPF0246 family)
MLYLFQFNDEKTLKNQAIGVFNSKFYNSLKQNIFNPKEHFWLYKNFQVIISEKKVI